MYLCRKNNASKTAENFFLIFLTRDQPREK
jgi:hypothetical protein